MLSDEKSDTGINDVPLYMIAMYNFQVQPATFKSLSLSFNSLIIMCLGVYLSLLYLEFLKIPEYIG